jgi:hypothetical protein
MNKIILSVAITSAIALQAVAQKAVTFAVNKECEEIIVSYTNNNSDKSHFVERLPKIGNEILYGFVLKMTKVAQDKDFDAVIFTEVDEQCQKVYKARPKSGRDI